VLPSCAASGGLQPVALSACCLSSQAQPPEPYDSQKVSRTLPSFQNIISGVQHVWSVGHCQIQGQVYNSYSKMSYLDLQRELMETVNLVVIVALNPKPRATLRALQSEYTL